MRELANELRCIALTAVLAAVGCGSTFGGDDDSGVTLTVDPPTTELLILDGAPAVAKFTATLTDGDGDTRDVTDEVRFSVDTAYGMFNGSTLTMQSAGKTQVFANLGDKLASAMVIGRLRNVRVDPSLPSGAADWFNNPDDASRAPQLVYPATDVAMPRNLGDFEVHWTDTQNDVFEVSLKTDFADVRAIVRGDGGMLPSGKWMRFLAAEWMAAVGYEPSVQFQVRGVSSANPTVVGSSEVRVIGLSNEQMLGGLYYWAAKAENAGAFGIFRHDMSKPGQVAEQFYTTAQTGGRCVACHVLSRDGTRMAVTYDGGDGDATLVDVASRNAQTPTRAWNFGTFTPDGNKFLAVKAGVLSVIDSNNQQLLATMTAAGQVSHPDLSPDGTRLVYVRKATATNDWTLIGGKLIVRTFDTATNSFGPEEMLLSDATNNYYPSFSPDGQWILFNRATTGSAYNNPNASLWVVKADGASQPVELVGANAMTGLTNSWGRWAPFAQTMGGSGEPMFWVTVSSMRDFGVRLVNVRRPQLWMTPFYPERAAAMTDPSTPAFRLPFQNIDSNNHIAQWTEQVVPLL